MDWKQFIVGLAGSLVWPGVVAYAFYLLRNEIIGLAGRLDEVSVGSWRAKFVSALKAAQDADVSPPHGEAPPPPETPAEASKTFFETAAPFASVLLGYAELEKSLVEIREKLDLPSRTNLISIVRELAKRGLVTEETVQAFNALRLARNAAAHAQTTITPSDAANFNFTAQKLRGVLQLVKASI